METVITVILAALMLTVFVVVHEWGHYIVAKKCGICVLEFSIGFGPKIAAFNSGETQITLRGLLFGGYVRFAGEEEDGANAKGSYLNAKLSHRAATVVAGPAMNIIFAYLLAVVFLCAYGDAAPYIKTLPENSAVYQAGVREGDYLTEYNGVNIDFSMDIMQAQNAKTQNGELTIGVNRNGEQLNFSVPVEENSDKDYKITLGYEKKTFNIGEGFMLGFKWLFLLTSQMLSALGGLFAGGQGVENMAGMVGTVSIISDTIKMGWESVLRIASLISVNLAVINMLPLPALDGGKLVLYAVEAVRRKPAPQKLEGALNLAGFALIIGFAVFLTFQDISRIAGG